MELPRETPPNVGHPNFDLYMLKMYVLIQKLINIHDDKITKGKNLKVFFFKNVFCNEFKLCKKYFQKRQSFFNKIITRYKNNYMFLVKFTHSNQKIKIHYYVSISETKMIDKNNICQRWHFV